MPGEPAPFTPAQRRALAVAATGTDPIACPACGAPMARHPAGARPELPYVRHRVLLICPGCRRSVSVDVKPVA